MDGTTHITLYTHTKRGEFTSSLCSNRLHELDLNTPVVVFKLPVIRNACAQPAKRITNNKQLQPNNVRVVALNLPEITTSLTMLQTQVYNKMYDLLSNPKTALASVTGAADTDDGRIRIFSPHGSWSRVLSEQEFDTLRVSPVLALSTGSGKTLTALALALKFGTTSKPSLIVVPNDLVKHWQQDALRHGVEVYVFNHHASIHPTKSVIVASFADVRHAKFMAWIKPLCLMFIDEVTHCFSL